MTEKEKMLSGETYYARDPELIKLHKDCRKSLKELNSITSDNVNSCLLYTSPSPRDMRRSRMPSSA